MGDKMHPPSFALSGQGRRVLGFSVLAVLDNMPRLSDDGGHEKKASLEVHELVQALPETGNFKAFRISTLRFSPTGLGFRV